MTNQPVSAAPAAAVQLDLPPLPAASQLDQQVVPFSQLLQQAQPSAPSPATAPPPSPPPPPRASSQPTTNTVDRQDNGAPDTSNSNSSTSGPANEEPSSPAKAGPATADRSQGANSNAPQTNSDEQHAKVALQATASGSQQKAAAKKADAAKATQPVDETSATTAATAAATVVAPKPVAQKGDPGKSSKQSADEGSTKDQATGDKHSTAAPVPSVTSDVPVQAIVSTTTNLPPSDNSVASPKTNNGTKSVKAGDAKQIASTAAQLMPQQRQAVTAQQVAPVSPEAALASDRSAQSGQPQPTAKNGDATTTNTYGTTKFADVQAAAAQSNDVPLSNSVEIAPPQPAVQAITATAASEPQVVSTAAVDPASPTSVATPNISDAAPTNTTTPQDNAPPATPSAFAASISQAASQANTAGPGINTVDRARFVQRVARAFQVAGSDGGQMRLRLSPPELGSLQMQISVKQGALTAHIQTDNTTAQQALLDSLPDLRDRLAQQDIHIERFDVELTGQSSGGLPQSPQGNPDFDQAGRRSAGSGNSPVSTALNANDQPVRTMPVSIDGALNVVV